MPPLRMLLLDEEIVLGAREHVDDGVADAEDVDSGVAGMENSEVWEGARTIPAQPSSAQLRARQCVALNRCGMGWL